MKKVLTLLTVASFLTFAACTSEKKEDAKKDATSVADELENDKKEAEGMMDKVKERC
jgi:protein involved in sex pheromone biosynthesis